MTKMKTNELRGKALEHVVTLVELARRKAAGEHVKDWVERDIHNAATIYPYTTDWLWGGEIIDREHICKDRLPDNGNRAYMRGANGAATHIMDSWRDPYLVVAMRCYVASRLGDEVDVPEELLA